MNKQVYISDILDDIRSIPNIDITHFGSADLFHDLKSGRVYVISTINGIDIFIAEYNSWNDYTNHIGRVVKSGILYSAALKFVYLKFKELNQ